MTRREMIDLFVEISKKHIPAIDDTDLEYYLRKLEIDNSGPICSDNHLWDIFIESTHNQMEENKLYPIIENICLEYCNSVETN